MPTPFEKLAIVSTALAGSTSMLTGPHGGNELTATLMFAAAVLTVSAIGIRFIRGAGGETTKTLGTKPRPPADPLADFVSVVCQHCGYDIRATPERCPECGMLVPNFRRPLDPRKLRENWPLSPIQPRKPGLEETLVRIWDAPNPYAATLLIHQLEQRGVQAFTQKLRQPMRVGNYTAPPTDFAVCVWSADTETTEAILSRLSVGNPQE